jgi:hypothetical protein
LPQQPDRFAAAAARGTSTPDDFVSERGSAARLHQAVKGTVQTSILPDSCHSL